MVEKILPAKCQVCGSSVKKEEPGVQNDVASGEVDPESTVYHWPDRAKGDKYMASKNNTAIANGNKKLTRTTIMSLSETNYLPEKVRKNKSLF